MKRPGAETVLQYALAIFTTVLAFLIWESGGKHLGATPYLFFLTAVVLTSWVGGLGPGLVATLCSALLSAYFYLEPSHSLSIRTQRGSVLLALFMVLSAAISWLNEMRRRHEREMARLAGEMRDLLGAEREARSAAQEAEARATFLARASDLLATSLDYEVTLRSVAQLAVPQIADWCGVHIVDSEGEVRQIAITHIDPAKVTLARELEKRYPYDPNGSTGAPHVLRTGQSELIPEIPDELLQAVTPDAELLQILRDLGLRSSMVVPLIARGHTLGAITFVAAESGRRFGSADLMLAEELANRAALAVDNAELYRESQRVGAERQAIMSSMVDGVTIVDPKGRITFTNDAAQAMTGRHMTDVSIQVSVEPNSVRTMQGEPLAPEDLPLNRALRDRVRVADGHWRLSRQDGVEIVVQGNASPVIDADGNLLGAVSVFRDVTAQWSLERQKEEFLSAAAHDLKTPLASIKGLSQIALRRLKRSAEPADSALSRNLQQIDAAATRMTGQINELLDSTRAQLDRPLPLNLVPADLVSLSRDVVAHQREVVDGHKIRVVSNVKHLPGQWDAERLGRVLDNLLANAVKYSPAGGEVVVHLDAHCGQVPPMAVVAVEDHGIGIPAQDLPHVTERFYRARNVDGRIPGTGIGLAGVRQIVEQHGGTLTIESREQEGTTVTVKLPLNGEESTDGEPCAHE